MDLVKTPLVAGSLSLSHTHTDSHTFQTENCIYIHNFFSRSVTGNSVKDHLVYLGVNMKAETWGTCRIVMDYSVLPYQMDLAGNVVLSKDVIPKESESRSIVQVDKQGSSLSGASII